MNEIATKAKIELSNLSEAEKLFIEYQLNMSGSFYTGLFNLYWKADHFNKRKLEIAFPDVMEVIRRYSEEEGYWEDLKKRAGIKF